VDYSKTEGEQDGDLKSFDQDVGAFGEYSVTHTNEKFKLGGLPQKKDEMTQEEKEMASALE